MPSSYTTAVNLTWRLVQKWKESNTVPRYAKAQTNSKWIRTGQGRNYTAKNVQGIHTACCYSLQWLLCGNGNGFLRCLTDICWYSKCGLNPQPIRFNVPESETVSHTTLRNVRKRKERSNEKNKSYLKQKRKEGLGLFHLTSLGLCSPRGFWQVR